MGQPVRPTRVAHESADPRGGIEVPKMSPTHLHDCYLCDDNTRNTRTQHTPTNHTRVRKGKEQAWHAAHLSDLFEASREGHDVRSRSCRQQLYYFARAAAAWRACCARSRTGRARHGKKYVVTHLLHGLLSALARLGGLLDDLLDGRHLGLESLQLRVLLQNLGVKDKRKRTRAARSRFSSVYKNIAAA